MLILTTLHTFTQPDRASDLLHGNANLDGVKVPGPPDSRGGEFTLWSTWFTGAILED